MFGCPIQNRSSLAKLAASAAPDVRPNFHWDIDARRPTPEVAFDDPIAIAPAQRLRSDVSWFSEEEPHARFSDLGSRTVVGRLQRRSYQAEHEWAPGTGTKHWIAQLNAKPPPAHWCRSARRHLPHQSPIRVSFARGGQFAAWLGLTPLQKSSGGKERLGRIANMVDRYLRKLLIVGMTSLVRRAKYNPTTIDPRAPDLPARKPTRVAMSRW